MTAVGHARARRVLQVITRADAVGGAHTHVVSLSRELRARGHQVLVACGPPRDGPYRRVLHQAGLRVVEVPDLVRFPNPIRDVLAVRQLADLVRGLRPDVVHAHSSKAGLLARAAANATGRQAVFTAHGWAFAPGVGRMRATAWQVVERTAATCWAGPIVVVSDHDRRLGTSVGIDPQRMTTVRNAVEDVDPSLRAEPFRGAGPPRLVMVARFDVQKDHPTLLRALRSLDPELETLLVGDGPGLDQVRAELAGGGPAGVHLLGLRDDVPRLLASADVFVLATKWEGLPISVIEAMRAGLPVIASDVGGVSELVVEGETGLLVGRGDSSDLARAIRSLLVDPARAVELGRAGRRRYEREFGLAGMVDRLEDVYRRVDPGWPPVREVRPG